MSERIRENVEKKKTLSGKRWGEMGMQERNKMIERVRSSVGSAAVRLGNRVLAIYVFAREPSSRVEFPSFPYVGSKCGSSPVQKLPLLSQQHKNTGFKNALFPRTVQQRAYHTIPKSPSFFRSLNRNRQTEQRDQKVFTSHVPQRKFEPKPNE